ncbi:MAG: AAA family ATPase [Clostridia bacterium]|nr:AAA family ATPase [Clostridia bacterium]
MVIHRIHIASFGPLRDFDFELYSGMNVIRGENESGKTSLAMFIKFIFYGLSGRSIDSLPSERRKYVNWETGTAEGYIIASHDGKEYRIERSLSVAVRAGSSKESVSETVTVTDTSTGERVHDLEDSPGAAFFGVPEQVFFNTVFSGQMGRSRINGADTAVAVENMLFSADETVNVKKAAEKLDKFRRTLLHKKGEGGEIVSLRAECAELKERLAGASSLASEIIERESSLDINVKHESDVSAKLDWQNSALKYYDAVTLCRAGDDAREADKAKAEAEADLRHALSLCCEPLKLAEARKLAASIESERASAAEFSDRLTELEVGAASLFDPDSPEDPESQLELFRKHSHSAGIILTFAIVFAVLGVIAGALAAVMYGMKNQLFLLPLAVAAILVLTAGVFLIVRGRKFAAMRGICRAFGEESEEGLETAVEYALSRKAESEALSRRADSVRLSLEQSGIRSEGLETEADAVSASFEDCCMAESDSDGTADALERLRRAIALAERRQVAAEGAKAAYESAAAVAAAKWDRIPKDKLAAAAEHIRSTEKMAGYPENAEEADEIRRRLDFNKAKKDSLLKKIHSLEVELASMKAKAESPAELWDKLGAATEKLKTLNLQHDAALLAAETLAEAGENIRRDIIPRIVRRASKMFHDATEGRYESLGSGSTFELSAVLGGHTRDSALLSSGTEDLAYICLRIALVTELFGDKKPPIIFDESFAFLDPVRSAAASDIMAQSQHQVLLFTCRSGEGSGPTLVMKRR